jgi:hypothetical protein
LHCEARGKWIGDSVHDHLVELSAAALDLDRHQLPEVARQAARQPRRTREDLSQRDHPKFDQSLFELEEFTLEPARANAKIETLPAPNPAAIRIRSAMEDSRCVSIAISCAKPESSSI